MKAFAIISLVLLLMVAAAEAQTAKNVILMIADGQGFNGWEAGRYYQGGLPYDNAGFDFYGCTTYANGGSYNPTYMWSSFANHKNGATDSAAAATAIYSGQKTYSGAIGVDTVGNPIPSFAEIAAAAGKATAAITSVQYNHATPGAVDAHNVSRDNYSAIASDMISSDLDVIMGCDSQSPGTSIYGMAAGAGFTVVNDSDLSDWTALADGTYNGGNLPNKLFGGFTEPSGTLNGRVTPTLDLMTRAALNILAQDSDGFFMMVEGGAVDWNNHGNNLTSMLREQVDFDNAVASTMQWIEANGGWSENLLIITADHETGSIWGPTAGTFNNVVDNGANNLPGMSYNSGSHTNSLVPLWAKGAGSDGFGILVDLTDTNANAFWTESQGWDWDGRVIDNTDVFTVMYNAVAGSVPLGDANDDGVVDNLDIAPFVLALTNPAAYQAMFPDVDPDVVLDMNGDGVFSNLDIANFVAALTGP